jgi:trimethylamine--corrinoid protein Co-methyltransferase
MTGSLQMAVMSDEVISFVKRLMRGIEVTPATLATDVVKAVGTNGNYIGTDHTLEYYKREFWFPSLIDRQRWDDWQAGGALTLGERVQDRLNELLDTHTPPPLAPAVQQSIDAILAQAEARYAAANA